MLKHNSTDLNELGLLNSFDDFQLEIDGFSFAKVLLSRVNAREKIIIHGIATSKAILGDKSINCKSADFVLVNFKFFIGETIKIINSKGDFKGIKGRIVLENTHYKVILDRGDFFEEKQKKLEFEGGFMHMYDGLITKIKDKPLSYDEATRLIYQLSVFLSFINGRRCSPILLTGISDNKVIWQDYTIYPNSPFRQSKSWSSKYSIEGFCELWKTFSDFWQK